MVAGFAAGALANGSDTMDAAAALGPDWILHLPAGLPADEREADRQAAGLAAKGVRNVALQWDGTDPASLRRELRAMHRQGMRLSAVSGDLDAWQRVLREAASAATLLVRLTDRRPGLHDQKVRAAGRSLLGILRQATEVGLPVSLYPGGSGWAAEAKTLRDVKTWLGRFRPGQEIGLVLLLPTEGGEGIPGGVFEAAATVGFNVLSSAPEVNASGRSRAQALWIDVTGKPPEEVGSQLSEFLRMVGRDRISGA